MLNISVITYIDIYYIIIYIYFRTLLKRVIFAFTSCPLFGLDAPHMNNNPVALVLPRFDFHHSLHHLDIIII